MVPLPPSADASIPRILLYSRANEPQVTEQRDEVGRCEGSAGGDTGAAVAGGRSELNECVDGWLVKRNGKVCEWGAG